MTLTQRIKDYYDAHPRTTSGEIAALFGTSKAYVRSVRRRRGITYFGHRKKANLPKKPRHFIVIGGAGYTSLLAASKELGISTVTLRKYLREGRTPERTKPHVIRLELILPKEMRDWLAQATPTGATVSEFVASIITDAYHEEVEVPLTGEKAA